MNSTQLPHALALSLTLALLSAACSKQETPPATNPSTPPPVAATPATPATPPPTPATPAATTPAPTPEPTPAPATPPATPTVAETITNVIAAGQATLTDAQKAAEDAAKKAEALATSKLNEIKTIVDKATALVGEKKYAEALAALNPLASMQLNAEQQKLVDDLKLQIRKGLVGGALPGAPKP